MKAMILAAGLGTRLRPLTDRMPKALVEVDGEPILQRVIQRLVNQGFNDIVINVHHFAEQIEDFLRVRDFGANILLSDEKGRLLDTGGGIVAAMPLLFGKDRSPVLIHNVDILSNADLKNLYTKGEESSLLVSDRESSRKLIFDKGMILKGWENETTGEMRPANLSLQPGWERLAFSGIYTLTYEAVCEMKKIQEKDSFPIMDYFLNPRREEILKGVKSDDLHLIDIGKPATLAQASRFID